MRIRIMTTVACIAALGIVALRAPAATTKSESDRELAAKPVCVIARWNKIPKEYHPIYDQLDRSTGRAVSRSEVWATIDVQQSLIGDIAPGRYRILVSGAIYWNKDGRLPELFFSSMSYPQVPDITKPALWLLSYRKSWDPANYGSFLSADTGEAIQPLALRPYFETILRADRDERIVDLLRNRDEAIVSRALYFIAAPPSSWQWFANWSGDEGYARRREGTRDYLLVQHAQAVAGLLRGTNPEIRRAAAAVYAWLTKERSYPLMRTLRADRDPEIQKIARIALNKEKMPGSPAYPVGISLKGTYHEDFETFLSSIEQELHNKGFERVRDDNSYGPRFVEYHRTHPERGGSSDDRIVLYKGWRFKLSQIGVRVPVEVYDEPGWISVQVNLKVYSTRYAAARKWAEEVFGKSPDWLVQDYNGPPAW
jgi:hypothetical protein